MFWTQFKIFLVTIGLRWNGKCAKIPCLNIHFPSLWLLWLGPFSFPMGAVTWYPFSFPMGAVTWYPFSFPMGAVTWYPFSFPMGAVTWYPFSFPMGAVTWYPFSFFMGAVTWLFLDKVIPPFKSILICTLRIVKLLYMYPTMLQLHKTTLACHS